MLLKYLFGDDIFISYTRADAITYAAGLANQLTAHDFSCFLDQWGTPPGRELPRPLKRALSRSAVLVLVGSDRVLQSKAVELEVREFRRLGRTIIPIDFGELEQAPWFDVIAGLARTPEAREALESGEPSLPVLARIEKSFQFTRRNQRTRRGFAAASALLVLLVAISLYTAATAARNAEEANRQAEEANTFRVKAEEETRKAEDNRIEANKQATLAATRATEAQLAAERASEQERFARSRELASTAATQLPVDPAESLRLAQEAWRTQPTDEARLALRDAVMQSHVRFVAADQTGGITPTSFSSNGRLVILPGGNTPRIIETATGRIVAELRGHTKPVHSASFSPVDDGLVVTAAGDNTTRIWQWRTAGDPIALPAQPSIENPTSRTTELAARFSADGRFVITIARENRCDTYRNYDGSNTDAGSVQIWDVRAGRWFGEPLIGMCLGRGRGTPSVPVEAFTPDGRFVVYACAETASEERDACSRSRILDLETGRHLAELEGDPQLLEAVISEKAGLVVGRVVSRGASQYDLDTSDVRIWSLASGARLADLDEPGRMLQLGPDGDWLVTANERNAYLWRIARDADKADEKVEVTTLTPARILSGHTGRIEGTAMSRDGRFVLTAAEDRTARVWDAGTGKPAAILRGHAGRISSVAMSPDGRSIVTSSGDGTARVWASAMSTSDIELSWTANEVATASFADDGRIVAVDGGRLRTWSPIQGERRASLLPGTIKAVATDATRALVAVPDSSAWIYTPTGERLTTVAGDGGWIADAALAGNGATILTRNADGSVGVWDAASGHPIRRLAHADGSNELSIGADADGRRVVMAGGNGTTELRDTATGKLITTFRERFRRARLSPDGRWLLAFTGRDFGSLWNADTGEHVVDLRDDGKVIPDDLGHREAVTDGGFSADGRRIVTIDPYAAVVWTMTMAGRKAAVTPVLLNRRAAEVGSVLEAVFSRDGTLVATIHTGGGARLWDAITGRNLFTFNQHKGDAVAGAAFSADGLLIATVSTDGTARLWDRRTQTLVRALTADARDLAHVAFTPDSTLVVAGTTPQSDESFVWRVADGRRIGHLQGHSPVLGPRSDRILTISRSDRAGVWDTAGARPVGELAGFSGQIVHASFSTDNRFLLTVTGELATRVWDARTGRPLAALRAHKGHINTAAFSADARSVVTASQDETAVVWEWRRGAFTILEGRAALSTAVLRDGRTAAASIETSGTRFSLWSLPAVRSGAATVTRSREIELNGEFRGFSPDGRYVLTIGDDQIARIAEAASGRLVTELRGHLGAIHDASFSPDSRYVVTASEDRSARLWETQTGVLMSELLGHDEGVQRAVFSPDGRFVLTKSKMLRLFSCVICGTDADLVKRAATGAPVTVPR